MTISPPQTRKFTIDALPRPGEAQSPPKPRAVSALPVQGSAGGAPKTVDQQLDKLARDLVGQTFFGTLLKQMHNSPFKSELFSGGRGEQAFAPMFDQQIAQRMTRGVGEKLVRPIVKKFQKAAEAAYRKQKEKAFVDANRRA